MLFTHEANDSYEKNERKRIVLMFRLFECFDVNIFVVLLDLINFVHFLRFSFKTSEYMIKLFGYFFLKCILHKFYC